MKTKGTVGSEWGFKNPTEGIFNVLIGEEIDVFTNENTGKSSLRIPTIVVDNEEFNGAKITIFCPMDTNLGENRIADVVANAGLANEFEKAFPGDDVSYFDAKVIRKLQVSLPGKPIQLALEPQTRNGKVYGNIVKIMPAGGIAPKASPAKAAAAGAEDDAF